MPALDDADGSSPVQSALRQAAVFLGVILVGAAVIFGIMALLGQLVLHGGPPIDKPIYHWTVTHRIHSWKGLMNSLTKIGNTWSTRMAVVSAAVCLAVTWRRFKWLPALAFVVLSLLQRYLTHGIHVVAHRVGPPGFLHGTFPSGGSERTVVFFGLIAYFLWREFSGRRVTAIWAGAAVAAVAFNEGYSRRLPRHALDHRRAEWLVLRDLAAGPVHSGHPGDHGTGAHPRGARRGRPETAHPAASNGAQPDAARVNQ